MMDPLLDQIPMGRISRINDLDHLIIASPIPRVCDLQPRARDQHQQRQALRIHTGLHKFLRGGQVAIPRDEAQADRHAEQPRRGDDGIAVFPAEGLHALPRGTVHVGLGKRAGRHVLVLLQLRVPRGFEAARGPVCTDDCDEGPSRGHEEGAEGDRELPDDGPAPLKEQPKAETTGTAKDAAGRTAYEDGAVVGWGGGC